jgi:choline dehydrogenase
VARAVKFDVLVLGGGAAGCVLAARLSENSDRTVCLVEAGPDYGPYAGGGWPEDILDARWLALDSHCWERDDEDDRSQLRARILGGCSAHNACVVLRGAPVDYEWGVGWSYADMEPYLERAERQLRAHPTAEEDLSPWHRAFRDAAPEEAIVYPVNTVDGVRWNAAFAYVDPARSRANLTILAETLVDRVLIEHGRATGALADGRELQADTVVVSASAYGSPGILLRSGIGPADELARHRIPLVADLPVGDGLADHVGTGAAFEPTSDLARELEEHGAARHGFYMGQLAVTGRSRLCAEGPDDLFILPALDPDGEKSAGAFAMQPRSRGSVRLTSRDPRAPLAIDHGFLRDEWDAAMLTDAVELLRELASQLGREVRPGAEVDTGEYVRSTARGFFHPVGTCAIGEVVDGDCRVLGFENLHVVDASVMPRIPRVPVHLSTLAVAERMAERL